VNASNCTVGGLRVSEPSRIEITFIVILFWHEYPALLITKFGTYFASRTIQKFPKIFATFIQLNYALYGISEAFSPVN
jgi:hypothetical protein